MTGRSVLMLVAVVLAGFGWVAPWPDPAQAGQALAYVALAIGFGLAYRGGRLERLASMAGIGIAVAGASCATFYGTLTSQTVGSCDEATGRPATLGAALAVLAVAAEFLRGRHGKRSE